MDVTNWDTTSILGSTYQLKVYAGLMISTNNPQTNGTQLLSLESDSNDEQCDYQSDILNFMITYQLQWFRHK